MSSQRPTEKGPTVAETFDTSLVKAGTGGPDLHSQLDDLRLALRDWRRTRDYSQPTQERLEQITLQCARLVDSWRQIERRRNGSVVELDGRPADEAALDGAATPDTGDRIRALEEAIEHEWEALPLNADDRADPLTAQAASLIEGCVAAANLALRGFATAESRVAALEREIQTGMAQLSTDIQSVLTELRSVRTQALPGAAAFPLEGVMRIHQQLRDGDETAPRDPAPAPAAPAPAAAIQPPAPPPPAPEPSGTPAALAARVESLERTVGSEGDAGTRGPARVPGIAVAGLIAVLAAVVVFGFWLQRRVESQLDEAALRVTAAEQQRDATVAAARDEATRQVTDAQQAAARAQIVGNVLAAPDLVRHWLTGVESSEGAYAHVLFSRSRGLVFSASRLPPPGDGRTYQLWLMTRTGVVSGGTIAPDADGRVTLATDAPVDVPGRLTGAMVTVEPAGGRPSPTGDKVMVKVE